MGMFYYCRSPIQRTVIDADGNEVPMPEDEEQYLDEQEEEIYQEAMFLESLDEEEEVEREPWDTEE